MVLKYKQKITKGEGFEEIEVRLFDEDDVKNIEVKNKFEKKEK